MIGDWGFRVYFPERQGEIWKNCGYGCLVENCGLGFISQRYREVNGLDGSLEGKGKIELQQQRQNPIYWIERKIRYSRDSLYSKWERDDHRRLSIYIILDTLRTRH